MDQRVEQKVKQKAALVYVLADGSERGVARGIQGACQRDQMQQVFSIDRRKWSYTEATNPRLLQSSMDCCQGGCRQLPDEKWRKTEDHHWIVITVKCVWDSF